VHKSVVIATSLKHSNGVPLKPIAVPSNTIAATEAAPVITVFDTGIQDALDLILVQTSSLKPIPQRITVRTCANQSIRYSDNSGAATAFAPTYPGFCCSCKCLAAGRSDECFFAECFSVRWRDPSLQLSVKANNMFIMSCVGWAKQ